jgi:hypothetical protein
MGSWGWKWDDDPLQELRNPLPPNRIDWPKALFWLFLLFWWLPTIAVLNWVGIL